jgi:hypothetical protein
MRTCALVLMIASTAAVAAAQERTPPAAPGGLLLERIHNDFVVAPDFKVTDVDGRTGTLAGVSAGWLQEDALFFGGAGYWLTNRSDDFEMMYGGLVVGWNARPERRVQFGARGLVGVGRATLGTDLTTAIRDGRDGRGRLDTRVGSTSRTTRVGLREDFLVAEPQITFGTRLSEHFALNWAAGYRFAGLVDRLGDRLNGPTGTVSLQFRP